MTARCGQVVRLLADGAPHSGEAIAAALGVSRTAVWKLIGQAREQLGLEVEAVRGQGYRLSEPLELLDRDRILLAVGDETRRRLRSLEILESIGSTSSHLLERARAGPSPGGVGTDPLAEAGAEVCLAERQTAGRGRLGRTWVSPFGRNLYLSVLWHSALSPAELGGLSLVCGVAVASGLRQLGAAEVGLKWPNDVHWHRRKLAGLLLEVGGESQGPSYTVVGVGLNLRLTRAQGAAIEQPWVDLAEVMDGRQPSRNRVAATVIEALCQALERYPRERLAPVLDDWRRLDAYEGESVELIAGTQRRSGVYRGIDDQGNLILQTDDGCRSFAAGEVSLRPSLE
jgi:BirA family biotin operon repressor/biotin-[acetyl-CoA-carboxylase] ligase